MSVSVTAVKGFLTAEIKASMSPWYAFIVLGDLFKLLRYSVYFVFIASFRFSGIVSAHPYSIIAGTFTGFGAIPTASALRVKEFPTFQAFYKADFSPLIPNRINFLLMLMVIR